MKMNIDAAKAGGFLVALFSFVGTVAAQTTVSGTVTDAESGETLPGVNVVVQGTTTGTSTDIDGGYEVTLPEDQETLEFSFLGYQTEEVDVSEGQTTVNVGLSEDVLGLDEVVVTGLASSIARENLANSVETISARELSGVTTPQTLDGAISGKVTGAVISSYTGAPGGGMSVKMRGITTINGRSQPLFVVDGLIIDNSSIPNGVNAVTAAAGQGNPSNQDQPANRLADLVPQDIESIEILKGPSAAAIYGARASNGVVVITTKRGRSGEGVNFSVSQSLGFSSISHRIGSRAFTAETAEATYGERGRQRFEASGGNVFDYEDELYGNVGLMSTTRLSAAGGTENTTFYASGLIKSDEGIVKGTGYDKQSVRLNLSHRFSDFANVDVSTNYIRSVARRGLTGNDNSGTTYGVALAATPNFIDLYPDENGVYPEHPFSTVNPLQMRDLADIGETNNRFLGSARLTLNLLQEENQHLQAIAGGGADYYGLDQSSVFPVELQNFDGQDFPGASVQGRTTNLNTNLRGALVYSLNFPRSNLFITTQGGFTYFSKDFDRATVIATGLIAGQQNIDQAASVQTDQFRSFQDNRALFIQGEANWASRLIGTVGLRAERSSANGDVGQYFTYPKASLALNLTNFDFWNVPEVDLLKFRAAFGQTGNTAPFGSKFTTFGPIAIDGTGGININGVRGTADIKPERASEIEGGVDLGFYNGRVNLELTAYRKVVEDLVLTRQLPPSTGFGLEVTNAGELTNTGFEAGLNLIPVQTDEFQWVSRTNFWVANSTISLPDDVPPFAAVGGGFGSSLGLVFIEDGKSPTQIIGPDDRFDNLTGEPGADGLADEDDANEPILYQLGDVSPDFQMSFHNNFTLWDNLSLTVLAHWKQGGDVINLSELLLDLNGTSADFDEVLVPDPREGNEGEIINERLLAFQRGIASQFVQDGSYFKIREIGLYYQVPSHLLGPSLGSQIKNLRIGISGTNLFTFTPFKGYDPEVHNFGANPVASGVAVLPYPTSRSFQFHLGFSL